MTEWDPEQYSRRSALQKAMAAEVLASLDLQGTERVLDVGCGDGSITAEIAARLPAGSVTGVDASQSMIEFAAHHFAGALPNLQFQKLDARFLTFHSEFDLVVSFNALHWIPQQEEALRSIWQALKPDAKAQLRLVAAGKLKSLEAVIEETRLAPRWVQYFSDFQDPYLRLTPEQYLEAAQRNGFRVLHVDTRLHAWDFGSRESFYSFGLATFHAWTKQLPQNEIPSFIKDVLGRYRMVAQDTPAEENTFKFYQMNLTLARS